VDVAGLTSGVTAITARYYHSCAVTTGGGVKCRGLNDSGQLGDGSTTDRPVPVEVRNPDGTPLIVTAGSKTTIPSLLIISLVIVAAGVVLVTACWFVRASRRRP
jgi:alpha-tubulin suppressor-like RCC1 family protein